MGLKIAVKAHSEGDLALAEQHYREHTSGRPKPVLYQNYSALRDQPIAFKLLIGMRKVSNYFPISLILPLTMLIQYVLQLPLRQRGLY